jgi:hypothetical protein
MLVLLQLVGVAVVPLNVIVLVPWLEPKLLPLMVTDVPTGPPVGFTVVIAGAAVTVKRTPLLAIPLIETTTLPVVAPTGTGTRIWVSLQLFVLAARPLNVTPLTLVPTVGPKLVPLMVTTAPIGPDTGLMLEMFGGGVTVKGRPLLAKPLTVTTTFPVVAPTGTGTSMLVSLHADGVPPVPLNVTVLVLWVALKFVPVIVTVAPTGPWVRPSEARLGPGEVTVNVSPLLATPLTVTMTLPVVAPFGTGAAMLVALQLVGVVVIPLKVTVLLP